jgi:hypothetical protein
MKPEPPPHSEQLNESLAKNDELKLLLKTLQNLAEYERGQSMYQYYAVYKNKEEAWLKTSAGSWANASLSVNYYYLCNQFYGFIFCNMR